MIEFKGNNLFRKKVRIHIKIRNINKLIYNKDKDNSNNGKILIITLIIIIFNIIVEKNE
jgi:hypothetical protein